MITVASVSISPYAPSSTRSEKPDTMRETCGRSGSAAWPTRGMMTNSAAVITMVPAEAASERPTRSRRTRSIGGDGGLARSASLSRCRSISSQVPTTRNTTKRPRNTTLVVTGDTATSMKKARNAMSRSSRSVWRV